MNKVTIVALAGLLNLLSSGALAGPDIKLQRLAADIWLHTSYYTYPGGTRFPSNGLIVRDGDKLTLVDTAWGELKTIALLDAIESEIRLPVSRAIVTHSHGDRVAGIDVLKSKGIAVFAHPVTKRLTAEYGLPIPDHTLETIADTGAATAVGRIEVLFPGAAHAPDNIVIWLAKESLLFGGCAVRAAEATSAGNTSHSDLESWLRTMALLGEKYANAELVVPGHGEPGGIELIAHTAQVVRSVP